MPRDAFSTGSIALNMALSIGGWPRGHLVEIFGEPTAGKSTLGLLAAREAQRAGDEAAIIDADHTLDPTYAAALGLDMGRLLVCQPESGETGVGIATTLIRRGAVALVVIDSVAALVPEEELVAATGSAPAALQRRLVDKAARELLKVAHARCAAVLFINRPVMQRSRAGGFIEGTAGGSLLPSLAAVRVRLARVSGDTRTTRVRALVEKNTRTAASSTTRQVDLLLGWGTGIDAGADLLVAAYDAGHISARGGAFHFQGARLGNLTETSAALAPDSAWRPRVLAAVEALAPWRRAALPALPDDAARSA